jgi:hypothetical protein
MKDSLGVRRRFKAQPGSNMMTKTAVQHQRSESEGEKTTLLSPGNISGCRRREEDRQGGRLKRLVKPLVAETTLTEAHTQLQLQQWKERLRIKVVSLPMP